MKLRYIVLIISLISINSLFSQQLTEKDIVLCGVRSFQEKTQISNQTKAYSVDYYYSEIFDETVLYYVINFKPTGFIIVSANEEVPPVLGFSASTSCPEENISPEFYWWMSKYKEEIISINNDSKYSNVKANIEWQRLLSENFQYKKIKGVGVEPLLNTQWNQNKYYNASCPTDVLGPGGHAYAGCVATTLGQLMCYFRHPEKGIGEYAYVDEKYGEQYVNFSEQTYNYDLMTDRLVDHNDEIAKLLYHIGVSVDMHYGPYGSGMNNHKGAYTLKEYFGYDDATTYLFRDSIDIDWAGMLISHLDKKIPIYYAGWSDEDFIMGHAFVCDGYQDSTFFHFNWGWGGSADGFYNIDYLKPSGSDFTFLHEAIANGIPKGEYPHFFSGTKELVSFQGIIDDGSGPLHNYKANNICEWLIAPDDSVSSIKVRFLNFDLAVGDLLTIYDGSTKNHNVLGSFVGSELPLSVFGTMSSMLIVFEANSDASAEGFQFKYSSIPTDFCDSGKEYTESEGGLTDGSEEYQYHNNSNCFWKILPENASNIRIRFTKLDTEPENDVVKLYDFTNKVIVAEYSGNELPDEIIVETDILYVRFETNSSVRGEGFELLYDINVDIQLNNSINNKLLVYPNPVKHELSVEFVSNIDNLRELQITNLSGQVLFKKSYSQNISTDKIDVDYLSTGIYLISVFDGKTKYYKKVIIE